MNAVRKSKTEYRRNSENPLVEAKSLHDQYKVEYGNNILLDQAVRLVSHSVKTEFNDSEITDKTYQAYEQSEIIEMSCMRIARTKESESSVKKYELVRDIRTYLLDCLK
jgi:hypothetical protein